MEMDFLGQATLITQTPSNVSIIAVAIHLDKVISSDDLCALLKDRLLKYALCVYPKHGQRHCASCFCIHLPLVLV